MQSLRNRFNGNSQEVVDYARTMGIWKAMEKYQVKDYIAFTNFLEEQTVNNDFAICATTSNDSWAEKLLDAFIKKLSKMEAENQSLKEELHRLNLELEYHKYHQALRVEPKVS